MVYDEDVLELERENSAYRARLVTAENEIAHIRAELSRLRQERDEVVEAKGKRSMTIENLTEAQRAWLTDNPPRAASCKQCAELREALGTALVAMKIAAALPGVSDEYDLAPAIEAATKAYACGAR